MRGILRFFVKIALILLIVPAIWFVLYAVVRDMPIGALDQQDKLLWTMFAALFLSIWPLDAIEKKLFPRRQGVSVVIVRRRY